MQPALLLLFVVTPIPLGVLLRLAAVFLPALVAFVLWERVYRRKWQQQIAGDWRPVDGRFDEGQVVEMRKGRSDVTAGYEIWLTYRYNVDGREYQADGVKNDLYNREYKSKEEAEAALSRLANQVITVRVRPDNPKRSRVLDEDLRSFIGER